MNLSLADLQYWLRHQQAWCDLRNCQSAGWGFTLQRWLWWSRILRTPPLATPAHSPDQEVELHTMCHRGDWLLVPWMVKSFARAAGNPWPVVVHVQGHLPPSALQHLRHQLPAARIILREESDPAVVAELVRRGLARCVHWRHDLGIMHKLLDVHVLATARKVAFVDADVLFYRKPSALLDAAAPAFAGQLFQKDVADGYTLSREEARTHARIDLAPAINTGITLRPRDALRLERLEELLGIPAVARRTGHLEQTLHALAASESSQVNFLPADYAIDMQRPIDPASVTCRHYAGPSKRFINQEGLRWLWSNVLSRG